MVAIVLNVIGFAMIAVGFALILLPRPGIHKLNYAPLGSAVAVLGAVIAIFGSVGSIVS